MSSTDKSLSFAPLPAALPFWVSLLLIPVVWIPALYGGWWALLPILSTWHLFAVLDLAIGQNRDNPDPGTAESELFWYRVGVIGWVPLQFVSLYALIWYVSGATHLSGFEKLCVFVGVGVMTGGIGINYAHELMHQKNRLERGLADWLLAMVLYSHFRSEHLLVHHRHVGTPSDPVTARYNEGFHRFYPRVLRDCLISSFRAEAAMLARRGKPWWDRANPFWRYWGLQLFMIALAFLVGGWGGLALFAVQAGMAIFQLELVNYVEHYGLTRRHLGNGKFEHVQPHHSWNAPYRASNWLLINLQRHSDHHYKPDRRFPLLQTYAPSDAPQLPFGYPVMTLIATVPPLWRRIMNPQVRAWRKQFYPDITDWRPYNKAQHQPVEARAAPDAAGAQKT